MSATAGRIAAQRGRSPPAGDTRYRRQAMPGWNLADVFETVVDAVAGREAVVADDGRLTYAELDDRANRLAHLLAGRGVTPGDRVGLLLRNGSQYLETMLAAFKLQAIPVNVHHRYTVDELAYLFSDAGLAVVVHEADLADRVAAAPADASRRRSRPSRWAPSSRPPSKGRPRCGHRPAIATGTLTTSSTPAARPACPRA